MERSLKECNRHEKRPLEDDVLRVCQTCNRSYYACELCRNSRGIDAPLNICNLIFFQYTMSIIKTKTFLVFFI